MDVVREWRGSNDRKERKEAQGEVICQADLPPSANRQSSSRKKNRSPPLNHSCPRKVSACPRPRLTFPLITAVSSQLHTYTRAITMNPSNPPQAAEYGGGTLLCAMRHPLEQHPLLPLAKEKPRNYCHKFKLTSSPTRYRRSFRHRSGPRLFNHSRWLRR